MKKRGLSIPCSMVTKKLYLNVPCTKVLSDQLSVKKHLKWDCPYPFSRVDDRFYKIGFINILVGPPLWSSRSYPSTEVPKWWKASPATTMAMNNRYSTYRVAKRWWTAQVQLTIFGASSQMTGIQDDSSNQFWVLGWHQQLIHFLFKACCSWRAFPQCQGCWKALA